MNTWKNGLAKKATSINGAATALGAPAAFDAYAPKTGAAKKALLAKKANDEAGCDQGSVAPA